MNSKLLQLIWLLLLASFAYADTGVSPNNARLCYSCEGINCQRTTLQNATTQCSNQLDFCVTIFDGLSVVAKGCYSEISSELRRPCDESDNAACQKCFGQLCNDKGRSDVTCITCTSSETSKCNSSPATLTPMQCDAPTALNTYCYVRNTAKGGISRGCAISQAEQLECLQDVACSMCLPSDAGACNTYALSAESAATTNGIIVKQLHKQSLIIAIVFVLKWVMF